MVIRSVVHEKASSRQGWKTMRGYEVNLVVVVTNSTWETAITKQGWKTMRGYEVSLVVVVTNSTWEIAITSVISPSINATTKLSTIAKIRKYRRLHEGIILFRWSWRCIAHLGMIWIVSSGSVLVFSMIDDWEVIDLCLFTFSFLSYALVLFFNML